MLGTWTIGVALCAGCRPIVRCRGGAVTRRLVAAWFALMAVSLAACEHAPAPRQSIPVAVTDSAGTPVYTLATLPPWNDSSFVIGLEVERSVFTGGASPVDEPLLYRPQAYARMPDGRLVVLDAGEERLVVLAASKDSVEARFGPSGQGPGEIWSANSVLWPDPAGDVWVLDPGNRRLSRFSLTGSLEEERSVEILGMGGIAAQRPGTHEPFFWKIFLGGPTGHELTDSIGRFDQEAGRVVSVAPMAPRVEERRRNIDTPRLFAPMAWFAPVGEGVVVGRSDSGRFRHYSDRGDLIGIVEIPMSQAGIDKSEEAAILEEFYGAVRNTSGTARGIADTYPLFNLMWALNDSLFALQQTHRGAPGGEPRIPQGRVVWRVFSVRGGYAGSILFPEGVAQPYWIEGDRIVATQRDSFGVATIVSFVVRLPGQRQ